MKGRNHGNAHHVRGWLAAAALACFSLSAAGQSVNTTAYDKFMARVTGASQSTIGYGSNGTPVSSASPMTLVPDGGTGMKSTQSGTVRNPAGNPATITATGRVSNAAAAGAIGRFAGKVFPWVAWPLAIKQLVDELGFVGSSHPETGEVVLERYHSEYCAANCQVRRYTFQVSGPFRYNSENACAGLVTNYNAQPNYPTRLINPRITGNNLCTITRVNQDGTGATNFNVGPTYQSAPPNLLPLEPATMQEFIDAIAAKSGWPASSRVAEATVAAAEANQEKVKPENVTVTGPAQTQGKKTTTTSVNPDGSTRTETRDCKWNHTYSGAVIHSQEVCTTTTTNDGVTGKTTTETETQEDAGTVTSEEEAADPCEANPERVGCAELDQPEQEVPKATKNVSYSVEDLGFGGGSCPPSPSWTDRLGTHTLNMGPICDAIVSWVRPLVLAMAALMALAIAVPRTEV